MATAAVFQRERVPWLRMRASSRAGIRLMLDTDRRLATRLFAVSVVEGLLPTAFTVLGGRLVAAPRGRSRPGASVRRPAGACWWPSSWWPACSSSGRSSKPSPWR